VSQNPKTHHLHGGRAWVDENADDNTGGNMDSNTGSTDNMVDSTGDTGDTGDKLGASYPLP
jgi:hypothetical protein